VLAAVAGGTLYTVGSHSVAGGKKCQGVASFEIATGDLTAWAPLPDYTGGVSTVADDTVYMEADDGRTGVARRSVTAVDARAGQALAWRGDIEGFDGGHIDGLAVVGAFGKVSGKPKESLAAIDSVTVRNQGMEPSDRGRRRVQPSRHPRWPPRQQNLRRRRRRDAPTPHPDYCSSPEPHTSASNRPQTLTSAEND
jgi:hypothetical protein